MKEKEIEENITCLENEFSDFSYSEDKNPVILKKILNKVFSIRSKISSLKESDRKKIGLRINKLIKEIKFFSITKKEKKEDERIFLNPYLKSSEGSFGNFHPVNLIIEEIKSFFTDYLGYREVFSPEIETISNNFDKLNFSIDHPARSFKDTFYFENNPEILLRTHATSFQPKEISNNNGEFASITVGKVYRRDNDDRTHFHQYNNVDIIFVGDVSLANLKWTIEKMIQRLFRNNIDIRMRPSYFPFTVPSVEVDIKCYFCLEGKNCSVCKDQKWIEILGAGMVHPKILGDLSKKYRGFAFGLGVERILMIKYGIKDIRKIYSNNPDFLDQFKK